MSAKNAIYTGQNQRDSTTFEGLQTDGSIFNASRSGHGYGNQQRYTIYNMYMCRWSIATFMMLTSVAEEQSAQTHVNSI